MASNTGAVEQEQAEAAEISFFWAVGLTRSGKVRGHFNTELVASARDGLRPYVGSKRRVGDMIFATRGPRKILFAKKLRFLLHSATSHGMIGTAAAPH